MFDYLIDHAIKNVWCNPGQDNQLIISPKRLTTAVGAVGSFKVMWNDYILPDTSSRYHVFQVGNLHPLLAGLLRTSTFFSQNTWVSLSETSNKKKVLTDVYIDTGVQIPRHEVFYIYNSNNTLLLAIKENKNIPVNYGSDVIYFRVYTNAYFSTARSDVLVDGIFTYGTTINNLGTLSTAVSLYNTYVLKPGHVSVFINGFLANTLDGITAKVGDTIEWVYDSSVSKVVMLSIADLRAFDSVLDMKAKYLLHYPDDHANIIEYLDDNDVWIVNDAIPGFTKGVLYHRNMHNAVRMVTHRDYSLSIDYLTRYADTLKQKGKRSIITCH